MAALHAAAAPPQSSWLCATLAAIGRAEKPPFTNAARPAMVSAPPTRNARESPRLVPWGPSADSSAAVTPSPTPVSSRRGWCPQATVDSGRKALAAGNAGGDSVSTAARSIRRVVVNVAESPPASRAATDNANVRARSPAGGRHKNVAAPSTSCESLKIVAPAGAAITSVTAARCDVRALTTSAPLSGGNTVSAGTSTTRVTAPARWARPALAWSTTAAAATHAARARSMATERRARFCRRRPRRTPARCTHPRFP